MYTVAFFQFDNIKPIQISLSHKIACNDGNELVEAVEVLCALIDYNPKEMDVDYTELRDSIDKFTDNNYVLLELYGSGVLVDIIVGKTTTLQARFPSNL